MAMLFNHSMGRTSLKYLDRNEGKKWSLIRLNANELGVILKVEDFVSLHEKNNGVRQYI